MLLRVDMTSSSPESRKLILFSLCDVECLSKAAALE